MRDALPKRKFSLFVGDLGLKRSKAYEHMDLWEKPAPEAICQESGQIAGEETKNQADYPYDTAMKQLIAYFRQRFAARPLIQQAGAILSLCNHMGIEPGSLRGISEEGHAPNSRSESHSLRNRGSGDKRHVSTIDGSVGQVGGTAGKDVIGPAQKRSPVGVPAIGKKKVVS